MDEVDIISLWGRLFTQRGVAELKGPKTRKSRAVVAWKPSSTANSEQKFPGDSDAADLAHNTQLCLALCDPMDCSPPGFSVHGILQARTLEWVAILFSRDLPDPGIEPRCLHCRQILYHLSYREVLLTWTSLETPLAWTDCL